MKCLDAQSSSFEFELNELLEWDNREDTTVVETAKSIIAEVRSEGDEALVRLTNELDHRAIHSPSHLLVPASQLEEALSRIPTSVSSTIDAAIKRIRDFHNHQIESGFEFSDGLGNQLGQRITPLERVGIYIPGGSAAYPSTVLMTVIPARVAGVKEVVVTVPSPQGKFNDYVLAALHLAGVDQVFSVGGAQAIAAMAYGTESISAVDKIVGPGNAWVTAAKKLVFGPVGIDSIAGPSEILVIADGTVDAKWTAWDLISQAEHDVAAQAILVSTSESYLREVNQHIDRILGTLPRQEIATASLAARGFCVHCDDLEQATRIANRIAPEHLQLAVEQPRALLRHIQNAGAIFLGSYSAEVMGDYVAGPSHVLPTFGTARYASPLGVYDFVKRSSIIELSPKGADLLGRYAAQLAELEGLGAHAGAARIRIPGFDDNKS